MWGVLVVLGLVVAGVVLSRRAPAHEPGSLSVVFEAGHIYIVTIQASRPMLDAELQVIRLSIEANGGRDVTFSKDKTQITFRRAPLPTTVEAVAGDPFLTVPIPGGGTVSFSIVSFTEVTP